MSVINIRFKFGNLSRIANVYYSTIDGIYTIYFTDVELILTFGNKAQYSKAKGVEFLKSGKDAESLEAAILRQLEDFSLAA